MARRADSFTFRAQAAQLNWESIVKRLWGAGRGKLDHRATRPDDKTLRLHSMDIHLAWACSADLGVPLGPFTVWTRETNQDKLTSVPAATFSRPEGVGLWWGGVEAACVEVSCDVLDPSKPVGLFLVRTAPSLYDTVAAAAVTPAGPTATIRLRCSGATMAVLVNGSNPVVAIQTLESVVNDPSWKPLEIVGLPVDQPWGGTAYDTGDQGPVSALVSPQEAAMMRLIRGGPIAGWAPFTQSGHPAPDWAAPDPKLLVKEVRKDLLPEITRLYDGATREYQQFALTDTRLVDGPQQGGRTSSLETTVDVGPWAMLMLPAMSDPFLNLATGFGSSYCVEPLDPSQIAVGVSDFLVTATYASLKPPHKGPAEMAAYSPRAVSHLMVPDPTGLTAVRAGLVAPPEPDLTWRESITLGWDRLTVTAALGSVTESAVARFDAAAGSPAESLLPKRDSGGWRPFTVSPDKPEGQPGNDRVSVSDGAAEIALGSGGRHVGYGVAVSDIFGIWSSWRDVAYNGNEPGPEPPRVISLALQATYAGSPSCPATLDTEISIEWAERTPAALELVALFFPMALPNSVPPAGLSPTAALPAGCFRRDLGLTFSGDVPAATGCTTVSLNADGDQPMTPGPGQGNGGRRYGLHAPIPLLDFGTTNRWGVQVFARRTLLVGSSPSPWSPDATHPALTNAASPVPVIPLPPPAPPGVPMGSTLDAQGCSHVRVHWSLPGGADVRTIVIWEVAEASLRQRCGLPSRAPDTDSPGVRLAALWAAYDALTPTQRRNAFRRVRELGAGTSELDETLPKGSTDIHLFVVTTVTTSGVDSPWPSGPGAPHEHLQAVIAPRLRRPGPPLARSSVAADGTVTIQLYAASAVPVRAFRLLRTRSEVAARSSDTMGPSFAEPTVDTPTPVGTDPVTGQPIYTATWTGAFPPSWDEWLVRAVALAVDTVPVAAVRGLPSEAGDVVSFLVPPDGPPDLAPLTFELWSGDHRGIVVRSSTTVPARALPLGSHRFTATAGEQIALATPIEDLAETPLTTAPAAAATSAVLERGTRAAGHSPVALWFTRPVATDPVEVTLRLVDPLGRSAEQSVTVPGFVQPPVFHLNVVGVTAVAGRGVVVQLACDADASAEPPYVMGIRATQRFHGFGSLRAPAGPFARPPLFGRTLQGTFPFDEIPLEALPFRPGAVIQVVRRRRSTPPHQGNYAVWVPLVAPVSVAISVISPDGARVSVTATA